MSVAPTTRSPSREALLEHLIDYAGLFPPAAQEMGVAVEAFARYRQGPRAWMLGRFIVPGARLAAFEAEALREPGRERPLPWRLSVLGGADPVVDVESARALLARHPGAVQVDALEIRAAHPATLGTLLGRLRAVDAPDTYVEIPAASGDAAALLSVVAAAGARAKIRTGGLTEEMIPPVAVVARFLEQCAEARLPFKATAGLHHPVRSVQRLTYAADSPRATMHGFVNVFVAAALAWHGSIGIELEQVLAERAPGAFVFEDGGVRWRHLSLTCEQVRAARSEFARAFGSCSFEEPVTELGELRLL